MNLNGDQSVVINTVMGLWPAAAARSAGNTGPLQYKDASSSISADMSCVSFRAMY
jgi:hypothetical protein